MKIKKLLANILSVLCALCMFFSGCVQSCSSGCNDGSNGGVTDEQPSDTPDETPDDTPDNEPDNPPEGGENGGGDDSDSPETDPEEPPEQNPDGEHEDEEPLQPFYSGMRNLSKVGYSAQYLGTAERTAPEVSNGGLARYPQYGVTLPDADMGEREAIIAENESLVAGASTYDSMDGEGNLYLNGSSTGRKLFRHTAAAGMYEGDLSDDEPAVAKRITYVPRGTYGNMLTGLYAPAGEVIKVEMSAEDVKNTGGIKVYIGQFLSNGGQNNIWAARELNRMPCIGNMMTVSDGTAYVGSFLGGPIYVAPNKNCTKFTVTITGAVNYPHYIHGYTTREEFEECRASTAPYFDLEVWDDSVRHSGPASRAAAFSYDELQDAAILWDKIACVSNQVPAGSAGSTGINFLYDPFIAAGSMVAFVGRHTVNCPLSCLTAALDARSAINNAGEDFWGCIHEFNHHYQKFGFSPGDEVTNNAVSLVEYSLFTRISSNRALGNSSQGSYASNWNRYTNPAWSLGRTLETDAVNSDLDGYANILHSFGQEKFIEATKLGGGRGGVDEWYRAVSDATGYDMTYYFTELLHQSVGGEVLAEYAAKNAPVFVPVATIFQVGRGNIYGGQMQFCRTAQPYVIRAGRDFQFDLAGSIVIPQGFTFQIKDVSSPSNGTLTQKEERVYVYTTDGDNDRSGEIYVTLGISRSDGAFEVDDVVLALEFDPGYSNAPVTRATYLYDDCPYASAAEAYEAGYAGYSSVTVADNANRIQNGNCEIWEPGYSRNAVMELSGKVYIPSDGKYRFALRGRYYAALYLSTDGQNYFQAGRRDDAPRTDQYFLDDPATFVDLDLKEGQYVWFKEVLLVTSDDAYIGLGMGKFGGDAVSVGHVTQGLNVNYEETPFNSDYVFGRQYVYDAAQRPSSQTLVSAKYSPWSSDYDIENLFDGDMENFIHSDRTPISAQNPFEITVDLGENMRVNRFTVYGEPSRQYQPKNFVLYGGLSSDQMDVIAQVTDAPRTDYDVVVDFQERELRYYKLVVTETYSDYGYIAFRRAEPSLEGHALEGAVQLSPDTLEYRGGWQVCPGLYTFGHAYCGGNASASFTFTGSCFGIIGLDCADCTDFEVYIDGSPAGTATYSASGKTKLVYASPQLDYGEHVVELKGSAFNIDSIAVK